MRTKVLITFGISLILFLPGNNQEVLLSDTATVAQLDLIPPYQYSNNSIVAYCQSLYSYTELLISRDVDGRLIKQVGSVARWAETDLESQITWSEPMRIQSQLDSDLAEIIFHNMTGNLRGEVAYKTDRLKLVGSYEGEDAPPGWNSVGYFLAVYYDKFEVKLQPISASTHYCSLHTTQPTIHDESIIIEVTKPRIEIVRRPFVITW